MPSTYVPTGRDGMTTEFPTSTDDRPQRIGRFGKWNAEILNGELVFSTSAETLSACDLRTGGPSRSILIEAVLKRQPPLEYVDQWARAGLVVWAGGPYADSWNFVREALEQLAPHELSQLYAETKAKS